MPEKTQENTCAMVRKLRMALGDTQPQFAGRLGLALPTVVRYEHSRRPRGKALALLEQIATANGLEEFATFFRKALNDELGAPASGLLSRYVHVKDDHERELVDALLYVIRLEGVDEYAKTAKAIRRVLKPIVELQRDMRETSDALDAQRRAIAGLLQKGRPAEEVMKLFKIRPEALAEAFFKCSMKSLDARAYEKKMREVVGLLLKDGMSIRRIADEFADGQADEIYGCANDLGDFRAISEYDREEEEENNAKKR
jgi:transcriptional regulator with XRE-family HTH domain